MLFFLFKKFIFYHDVLVPDRFGVYRALCWVCYMTLDPGFNFEACNLAMIEINKVATSQQCQCMFQGA